MRFIWQKTMITHAADEATAKKEFEDYLQKHGDSGCFIKSCVKICNAIAVVGFEEYVEIITSETKFEQNKLKNKKRPRLCPVNIKGVHEWCTSKKGVSYCIHCGLQIKNKKKVNKLPVKCLISGKHQLELVDIRTLEFQCKSCGKIFSLDKIAKSACEKQCKEPHYYSYLIYDRIKEFLRKNGRPSGSGKLTYKQVKPLFEKYKQTYPHIYVEKT